MKWIICSLSLFSVVTIKAQSISVSPYSAYGVGEQLFDNNTEQAGMGGISTVPTNPFGQSANFSNPAANRNLRMTTFNASGSGTNYNFKSGTDKENAGRFNVSNISLAFPVGEKGSFGVGFQPYTALGYDILNTSEKNNIKQTVQMKGDGGLNSLHAFYSRNLSKEFSLGLRVNYLFGELQRNEILAVDGASLAVDYSDKSNYRGAQFTLGSMYTKKIGKNNNLNIGATYTLGTKLRTDVTDLTTSYTYIGTTQTSVDTISIIRIDNGKTKIPQQFTLGASYSKDNTWSLAVEAKYNNWKDFSQPLEGQNTTMSSAVDYKNNVRFAVGGYWIPDYNSYKSYFNRVTYRAGMYYQSAQYSIHGTDIDAYGATLGFGFPIGKQNDGSMMNISLEYGQKGKTANNLIKENYFGVKVGFDINDIWFRKRVID
ncbi:MULTISPECIES: OmpP1/FadL family transporter [Empedobacter]|uniref:OmpP1/FadL family transporter n=1 Tax=Empedobacter TaxID=59734 RepID=UPI002575CD50|nr:MULTISPECIES: aromatic hydrocarbon degradation protein [Empedobacter]